MKTVTFTQEQYETLLKLAHLGNWLVMAHREEDKGFEEYEEMEKYLLSHAKEFGLEHLVQESDGEIFPSRELELGEEISRLIDEYNEETFWNELIQRLSVQEFAKKYSQEQLDEMPQEKYFEEIMKIEERNYQEFVAHGLERVSVQKGDFSSKKQGAGFEKLGIQLDSTE